MSSFIDGVMDSVDAFFAWLGSHVKQNAYQYCDLESAYNKHTLITNDGAFASMFHFRGVASMVDTEAYITKLDTLAPELKSMLRSGGHILQVYAYADPERSEQRIADLQAPMIETMKTLNLDLVEMLEEDRKHLAKFTQDEGVFFVVWTTPAILSKNERKVAMEAKKARRKLMKLPAMVDAQDLLAYTPEIFDRHTSFCTTLLSSFRNQGFLMDLLDVNQAALEVRSSVDPAWTPSTHKFALPNTRPQLRMTNNNSADKSAMMWPRLAKQVIPRAWEEIDSRTVRVGDRLYAPMYVEYGPSDPRTFDHFFAAAQQQRLPWRMSFIITGDGLNALGWKKGLISFVGRFSRDNMLVAEAIQELDDYELAGGHLASVRIAFATWAGLDQMKLLRERAGNLAGAVQTWGNCEVRENCGDACEGFASSSLGLVQDSVGTVAAGPMSDIMKMLPLTRPASYWSRGSMIYRTADGKLYPFQHFSSDQNTWNKIIFAGPGSGKSVLMAIDNLTLAYAGGQKRLPRIAIVDIGPTSKGAIQLLQQALPADQKHLVAHYRMRMTSEFAINPMATQLGSRFPTPDEKSFLVTLITILSTPAESDNPYEGISALVARVIDRAYEQCSDSQTSRPKQYTRGDLPKIDATLDRLGIEAPRGTSWWNVVDSLFERGYMHEAGLAQRYAEPLLHDLISAASDSEIKDSFSRNNLSNGMNIVDAMIQNLNNAIADFPILKEPTRFDIGEARIVALDLDEVTKKGGRDAQRRTAVMYMLARYTLTHHYLLTKDNVKDMHPKYQSYHAKRIEEIKEDFKRICYDEFHRTGGEGQASRSGTGAIILQQVVTDMREGRKWNLDVVLSSQNKNDFTEEMRSLAASIFILESGNPAEVQDTAERFGLTPATRRALEREVHGPTAKGSVMVALIKTKTGVNQVLLYLTAGPQSLWAVATTTEDAMLRDKLYEKIGPVETRRLLATKFAGGSAKKEVERRKEGIGRHFGDDDAQQEGAVDGLVHDLLTEYYKHMRTAA